MTSTGNPHGTSVKLSDLVYGGTAYRDGDRRVSLNPQLTIFNPTVIALIHYFREKKTMNDKAFQIFLTLIPLYSPSGVMSGTMTKSVAERAISMAEIFEETQQEILKKKLGI